MDWDNPVTGCHSDTVVLEHSGIDVDKNVRCLSSSQLDRVTKFINIRYSGIYKISEISDIQMIKSKPDTS